MSQRLPESGNTDSEVYYSEKAFTTNAAQARELIKTAKEKNLFLMEAVWTRFFPISVKIRRMIEEGGLGDLHRVIADNSFGENVEEKWGTQHRMVNMDLAGGALLDRKQIRCPYIH